MKILKGILATLVILFVVIMGIGAYLFGFNQIKNTTAPEHPVTEAPTDHSQPSTEKEKLVPVIVGREQVAPEEYLKEMQEALNLVKEATGIMTNEAYTTMTPLPGDLGNGTDPQQGQPDIDGMGKLHEGIYKMAQGVTILDIKMKGMGEEIKTARDNNISFYEIPGDSNHKLYAPYNPYGNYYNPYYSGGAWNAPNASGTQQPNPGSSGQIPQPPVHNTAPTFNQGLTSLFSFNTLVYGIYAILILSVIAGVVGVVGFLINLLKPSVQGRDTYAG